MIENHHPVPRSRGGTDDYTVALDSYDHAWGHAVDFVLFDHAPRFDFRLTAWPLLPDDLKRVVLEKTSRVSSEGCQLTYEDRAKGGSNVPAEARFGGRAGRSKGGKIAGGKNGSTQGKRNAIEKTGFCNPEVQRSNAKKLNDTRVVCAETGYVSTPGGLSRYQKARGIPTERRFTLSA
jgi:hypothetical protein